MWFLNRLIDWFDSVTTRFYEAYLEALDWISPFSYLATPLYYLYEAFFYITFYMGEFNTWLVWARDRINEILSTWDIWTYFEPWFRNAEDAWEWVRNATTNILFIVDTWWSGVKLTVYDLIEAAKRYTDSLVYALAAMFTDLQSAWDDFKERIPTIDEVIYWWQSWRENVISVIGTWWLFKLQDVRMLVASAFIEREPFWQGWQEMRIQVVEFFSDPVEFVWGKFADWFLGPEV